MTFLIGSGIPTLAVPAGSTALGMGSLVFTLLVVSALSLVLAGRRWMS